MKRTYLIMAVTLAALSGCRGGATPTPTAEPTAEVDAGALRVVAPIVNYREAEADPLRQIPVNTSVGVAAAANIVVGDPGRAEMEWPGFLEAELLAGADILVSVADPAARRVMMDQAAGTARYHILDAASGTGSDDADFKVLANWVEASVAKGPADLIVSFVPGDAPTAWIVVTRGEVSLQLDPDSGTPVVLTEGQGVGVRDGGPIPDPMAVDLPAVETWFSGVAAGTATTSIAPVAMVCQVSVAGALNDAAGADGAATDVVVALGDVVEVMDRDEAGDWALVHPVTAAENAMGWIMAGALTCNAPVTAFPQAAVEVAATPTSTSVATRGVIVLTATAPVVTVTPTGTATLSAVAAIEFWVDDNEIDEGECANLHWKTSNIDSVYLDGDGVTGEGSREVCPRKNSKYTLRVRRRDGSEENRTVEVEVHSREQAPPTSTPGSEPTQVIVLPTLPPPTAPVPAP